MSLSTEIRKLVRAEVVELLQNETELENIRQLLGLTSQPKARKSSRKRVARYRETLRSLQPGGNPIFMEVPWREGVSLKAWVARWRNAARRVNQQSLQTRKFKINTDRVRFGVWLSAVQ